MAGSENTTWQALTRYQGKRILIKDMAQYFIPSESKPVSIAPSLLSKRKGVGTTSTDEAATVNGDTGSHFASQVPIAADKAVTVQGSPYSTPAEKGNPTVVPADLLKQFHFAFLIRHPRNGIPSYYRCCIPPLDDTTGFYGFRNDEAGYLELRQLFDYLRSIDVIGPNFATPPGSPTNDEFATNGHVNGNVHANTNGHAHGNGYTNGNGHANKTGNNICVIDADDLLDMPQEAIQSFCESVGIEYHPDMLNWETEEEHEHARDAFEKWKGFHDDAIDSKDLKPRQHVSLKAGVAAPQTLSADGFCLLQKRTKSDEQYYDEWVEKYGKDGAEIIKKAVDENVEHYEYLRQFCVKF